MIKHPKLTYIGHVAVFYIPKYKTTTAVDGRPVKDLVHDFLVSRYGAYTSVESEGINGFWLNGESLCQDQNIRYEVSYEGREKIPEFLDFLSKLCCQINEQALYLRMGYKAYIIKP